MKKYPYPVVFLVALIFLLFPACTPIVPPPPTELVFRNWEGDISPAILDAFETEYGITVAYLPYESQEEVVAEMRAGKVYDVVVLENQLIPDLVAHGLLAEIDYRNVPNFKNISANFRDLLHDPENRHSIPYSCGTTGLVVRSDLAAEPITRWADMWDEQYAGKVMAWPLSRYLLGAALKSAGFSVNSESPQELEVALQRLIALRPHLILRDWAPAVAAPYLVSGEIIVAMGQADDVVEGRKQQPAINYVLPEEGAILWSDNFTIPAASPNKKAAEQLINFLLRADISARIANETYYWLPNDAALPYINPELRNNPVIFPPSSSLQNAEILLPLSPAGEVLYRQMWERFLALDYERQ